jgi:hypothetical protein
VATLIAGVDANFAPNLKDRSTSSETTARALSDLHPRHEAERAAWKEIAVGRVHARARVIGGVLC